MLNHDVLVIGSEVGNEVFSAVFWQFNRVGRDRNETKRLERPEGAALEFRHPFDFLMPIGIRADKWLPCLWRCVQRQFLYAPRLICSMPPRMGCWRRANTKGMN